MLGKGTHGKFMSPSVGVFGPPMSKFVFTRLARMVCLDDTRVYTGSGETSLRPVCCCSGYRYLICSMGYKQVREGEDPKSLVEGVNGTESLLTAQPCACVVLLCQDSFFHERLASPFIGQGKARIIKEEKEKNKREEGFQGCRVLLLLYAGPTNPIDVNRDGSMLRPCLSPAPCTGVTCQSWRSTPSQRTSW